MKGLAEMICLRELRREEDMMYTRVVIPSSLFVRFSAVPLFLYILHYLAIILRLMYISPS